MPAAEAARIIFAPNDSADRPAAELSPTTVAATPCSLEQA
jgi:hypothetical protein